MRFETILNDLQQAANPSRRKTLIKRGADATAIGVPLGFLRSHAKSMGTHHEIGVALWETSIADAQLLSVMVMDGSQVSVEDALSMIQSAQTDDVCDDLIFRCLVHMSDRDALEKYLQDTTDDVLGKAYWALIVDKLTLKPIDPYLANMILDSSRNQLVDAPPKTQWMLNRALCELGFRHPEYTEACLALGEQLGVYKDMVVAKGCTSAYAPAWIEAVLKRS